MVVSRTGPVEKDERRSLRYRFAQISWLLNEDHAGSGQRHAKPPRHDARTDEQPDDAIPLPESRVYGIDDGDGLTAQEYALETAMWKLERCDGFDRPELSPEQATPHLGSIEIRCRLVRRSSE
ncbi:hypothetical protein [Burkholderia sp. MS455]|uniref:hypothetical protein n=1 Tax=Burkholderia sp. MS455 TaxID=2811788 RepID=UPI00195EB342|nr:hypothetical protein [Burkholderia sp. MS455]